MGFYQPFAVFNGDYMAGQATRDFERIQIGDIHLRRNPQQRILHRHLDRRAARRSACAWGTEPLRRVAAIVAWRSTVRV